MGFFLIFRIYLIFFLWKRGGGHVFTGSPVNLRGVAWVQEVGFAGDLIPFGTSAEGVEILHHEPAIVTSTASVAMVDEKVSLGVGGVTWWREEEKLRGVNIKTEEKKH